ncbi:TMTC [Lepeophtheirus salmonis]|uniref:dolichyl-phosphate-mannose--protein mannosyltransferase n=1 Tax=Lepeophtheirus salmonis TaxID=72036 RepID=A0A7R8GZS6_LEPSM|nr:TMTC [Lepeophtheirus salmonis]CAF2772550.1 TMTC [Lepeophtheirus salmonis]
MSPYNRSYTPPSMNDVSRSSSSSKTQHPSNHQHHSQKEQRSLNKHSSSPSSIKKSSSPYHQKHWSGSCGNSSDSDDSTSSSWSSSFSHSASSSPSLFYGFYSEGGAELGSPGGYRRSILTLFTISVLLYSYSFSCGFVFDDITAVKDNRDLRPHVPLVNLLRNDFWGTPMLKEQSHKSYRPLTVFTFRLNYALDGLRPSGYHLVNILLHGLVTVLFYHLLLVFLRSRVRNYGMVSFLAALLFALHPVHVEAVTGVVGRAELLASLFYLGSLLAYSKASSPKKSGPSTNWTYLLGSLFLTSLATLSKEQGITATGVAITYELVVNQNLRLQTFTNIGGKKTFRNKSFKEGLRRIGALTSGSITLLLIRMSIMGGNLPVFTRLDNPAAGSDSPTRQLTFNYLSSFNFWLLLSGSDLCCDWTMSTVPLVNSLLDPRNTMTLGFFALLGKLLHKAFMSSDRSTRTLILLSLSLLVCPFLPASNLFFPVGFVVAERVLYLPSMGFCLLVAYGLSEITIHKPQLRSLLISSLLLLSSLHIIKTSLRTLDWKDEYSLFTSGLKVARNGNAKLYNNVGHALEAHKKHEEALLYFRAAVSIQPDDIGAHINVGRSLNLLHRYQDAEEAYLKAKSLLPRSRPGEVYHARVAPNHLKVFLNLATLIAKNGSRLEEADSLYRQAISMRADYTEAYINRGDILIKLNRTKEAQEVYEAALSYENDNPDIYYNLGVVFLEQGETHRALSYLNKALEYDPNHFQALLNSAILIQESGSSDQRQTAMDRLQRLVQRGDSNERVYFNLGMLSMDNQDLISAEKWFRKSIEIKSDFRSALFNLALLLSESGRPLEGAPFLHQLIRHYPDHIKGLLLLGDLYVNHHGDLRAAEKCYRRILSLEPNNVQGLHNLCVVMVEAGDLSQAHSCLLEAYKLAPSEDYIRKHLTIVEERLKHKR